MDERKSSVRFSGLYFGTDVWVVKMPLKLILSDSLLERTDKDDPRPNLGLPGK